MTALNQMTYLQRLEQENKIYVAALRKIRALDHSDKEMESPDEYGLPQFMRLTHQDESENLCKAIDLADRALASQVVEGGMDRVTDLLAAE